MAPPVNLERVEKNLKLCPFVGIRVGRSVYAAHPAPLTTHTCRAGLILILLAVGINLVVSTSQLSL